MTASSLFKDIMEEATQAAEQAGDKWVAENTQPKHAIQSADLRGNKFGPVDYILDVCGFAYINFKDKRSKFYKLAREYEVGPKTAYNEYEYRYYNYLHIRTKHSCRQELGLAEACTKAAAEVINKYFPGTVYVTSRID